MPKEKEHQQEYSTSPNIDGAKCKECGSVSFCGGSCTNFCKICGGTDGKTSRGYISGITKDGNNTTIACNCAHGHRLSKRRNMAMLDSSISPNNVLENTVAVKDTGFKYLFVSKTYDGEFVINRQNPTMKLIVDFAG
jgi:hypothetical protein